MRDVLHDELDALEAVTAETRDKIREAWAKDLPVIMESLRDRETESLQGAILEGFKLFSERVAEIFAGQSTRAVREGFGLGKRRNEAGGIGSQD